MRGKHGVSAAARHAIETRDSELAAYQRRVAELTAEVKQLRANATERMRAHSREVKLLKAERDEGLSPMVAVVQRENAALKERLDRAQRDLRELRKKWERAFQRASRHFLDDHPELVGIERVEAAASLLVEGLEGVRINDGVRSQDTEAVTAIQRARGERR